MIIYYTKQDLISFGNYVLSKKRRKLILEHPAFPKSKMLKERLMRVHHADIGNWIVNNKKANELKNQAENL